MNQEIPGTTVFTGERSRQGYRLNRMANSLSDPRNRERFSLTRPDTWRRWG